MARSRLSPLVTLIIGYILGYVLYPVSQQWTCTSRSLYEEEAEFPAHAQSLIARRSAIANSRSEISFSDRARDKTALAAEGYTRNSAVYAPWSRWRQFITNRRSRPSYLSSEYTVRGRIFIGVITTEQYLNTRAKAIHETWAREIGPSSKIVFYVGLDCNVSQHDVEKMSIVRLGKVPDKVYPPQRKVFAALQHMYHYHGNSYQWFVRADDDVYVRFPRLDRLLGRLDPNEKVYLGRPGIGRKQDVQRLELKFNEYYCMGGPGVVLSRATLREVAPHLQKCLETVEAHNLLRRRGGEGGVAGGAWFNEDVELGRCISRTVGVQCSSSKEVMNYFVQDYESAALRPSTLWGKPLFQQLITLHPIKQPEHMYSVHQYYTVLGHQATHKSLVTAQNTIEELCRKIPANLLPQKNNIIVCPT